MEVLIVSLIFICIFAFLLIQDNKKENNVENVEDKCKEKEKWYDIYYACLTNYIAPHLINIKQTLFDNYIVSNNYKCKCGNKIADKIDFLKKYNELAMNSDDESYTKTKYIEYLMRCIFFNYLKDSVSDEMREILFSHQDLKNMDHISIAKYLNPNKISFIIHHRGEIHSLCYKSFFCRLEGNCATIDFHTNHGDEILCFECFERRVVEFFCMSERVLDEECNKIKKIIEEKEEIKKEMIKSRKQKRELEKHLKEIEKIKEKNRDKQKRKINNAILSIAKRKQYRSSR